MHSRGRRRFLKVALAAATGTACSSSTSFAPVGDVSAGAVSGLPVGSLRPVGSEPVCIGRDGNGVYAMTLTCTHQGCDMGATGTVSPQGIQCGCHGSEFDANGNVVRGPANAPLQHFAVSVDPAGDLTIHGGTEVDASVRLAV
jgi:cytochrome b6-f complex iron-sulfur subunit